MTRRRMIGAAATPAGLSTAFGMQSESAQEMKKVSIKSANAKRTSLGQEVVTGQL